MNKTYQKILNIKKFEKFIAIRVSYSSRSFFECVSKLYNQIKIIKVEATALILVQRVK